MPTTLEVHDTSIQVTSVAQIIEVDPNQTVVTVNVIPNVVQVDVIIGGAGGGGGGGSAHVIQDEGSAMPAETYMSFEGAGVTVTDVPGISTTRVTIPGTSPGANFLDMAIWGTD